MAAERTRVGQDRIVNGFVSCPVHVHSVDLGTLTVLVDVRTGRVETLLGWAHQAWSVLARTGDPTIAAATIDGASVEQLGELARQLHDDGLLDLVPHPRPWPVPAAVATRPSWGTQEVPAALPPPGRTGTGPTVLAVLALAGVLLTRAAGRRSRSFHRIVVLLTAATRWPRHRAEPAMIEAALHCVRNVALVLPFRVACLEETAAAMLVLALTGRRAGWCHGIAADPIRLHAWIALDGRPVAEPASTARYTPLLYIPETAHGSQETPLVSTNTDTRARDPLLWLRGARVALGPFTRELVADYWRWEQEPQVIIGYGRQTPESLEARIAGYESQARGMADQTRFTVYDLTAEGGPRPVGTTALRIDHYVRTAEFVILLGGEGRGRGLSREATLLTLDYGFHITNLRAVWLKVLEHNTAGIRAYEGAGFKPVGRLRRCGYWLGASCDEIIMDALAEEFPGPSMVTVAPQRQ